MDHLRFVIRSGIPFIGIAIIAAISDEARLLLTILTIPFVLAIPLIIWSTVKMIGQVRIGQPIENKYIAILGFALMGIVVAICFFFVIEAVGSHGAYSGPFVSKCLFAFMFIAAIPLVDLILFRCSQLSDTDRKQKIANATIQSRIFFFTVTVFLLIHIIWPPLNMALRLNYRNIATAFITAGADVNKMDRNHCTPLWYSIHRVDLDMATILLNSGAQLDSRLASWGLFRAIETNNSDMLKLLLANGADINSTEMGVTPLASACLQKNIPIVKILLENGADVTIRQKSKYPQTPWDGKSAIDIAQEADDASLLALLVRYR